MESTKKLKTKDFGKSALNRSKRKLLSYLSPKSKEKVTCDISHNTDHSDRKTNDLQKNFENSAINQENCGSLFTDSDDEKSHLKLDKSNLQVSKSGPSYQEDTVIVDTHDPGSNIIYEQICPHDEEKNYTVSQSHGSDQLSQGSSSKEAIYAVVHKDKYEQLTNNLLKENSKLHIEIQDYLKKTKEEINALHKKLKNEMSQFEEETRREVTTLRGRLQAVIKERDSLKEQVDKLQKEQHEMHFQLVEKDEKILQMISPEVHKNMTAEYSRLLNAEREKHKEETTEILHSNETLKDEKSALGRQLDDTKAHLLSRQDLIDSLTEQNQQVVQERAECLEQLNESRFITLENQRLLLALLKVTENLAVERDILINKTYFQDNQQKELQATVVDYSLNLGRLQEHITNASKETTHEILKLQSHKSNLDDHVQQVYGKQIEALREQIFSQNNSIFELESEKKKLQSRLENVWDGSDNTYKDIFPKIPFV